MLQKIKKDFNHGILSQWRGYGIDGGYAIQFDKKKLLESINKIHKSKELNYHLEEIFYSGDNKLKSDVLSFEKASADLNGLFLISSTVLSIFIWSDQIWSFGGAMIVNTITEAKAHFSALIERVLAGEEVIIKRAGKPVAVLSKYAKSDTQRAPGALKGQIEIAEDFDELPDDIAKYFGVID